ncbi:MAG: Fic family protein [Methylococcales bacterium]|nr:Fic family protein [Methylococcales bacterium]
MLLYLIVKNHSFVDGNKRIAAACFLYFLEKNKLLYNPNHQSIVSGHTLASLTLLIAESKPEEKETIKQVVISILNRQ